MKIEGILNPIEFAFFTFLHQRALQYWLQTGKGATPGSKNWPKGKLEENGI